jgi:hypothetical protein
MMAQIQVIPSNATREQAARAKVRVRRAAETRLKRLGLSWGSVSRRLWLFCYLAELWTRTHRAPPRPGTT